MKRLFWVFFVIVLLAHASQPIDILAKTVPAKKPIMIEGAMPIEIDTLVKKLKNVKKQNVGSFVFYKGTLDNYPVIVTKMGKGMENTAAATVLAIEKFHPMAIINEGTAGGHAPDLFVFDIVLGKRTTNIGSLRTEYRAEGMGMDPARWKPLDLLASEGTGLEPSAENIRYFRGDKSLLAAANKVRGQYTKGKMIEGTIGSANIWNNEVDRIKWFHRKFGTSAEEMEGAAAAQITEAYNIPFLDIRIISNNIVNGGQYNPETATACQEFVYKAVRYYIQIANREGSEN